MRITVREKYFLIQLIFNILFYLFLPVYLLSKTFRSFHFNDIKYIFGYSLFLFLLLLLIRQVVLIIRLKNYELNLDEKYITYKSLFININKDYSQIKELVVKDSVVSRYGRVLIIKFTKSYRKIYIQLDSTTSRGKYKAIKKILQSKSGIKVIDKRN